MSFFKQVGQTVILRGFILIVSFVYNIVLSREMGAQGIGVVMTLLAFSGIAVQFGGLGLPAAAIYHIGLDRKRAAEISGTLITCGIAISVLLYFGFLAAAFIAPGMIGRISVNLYAVMMLTIAPLVISLSSQNLLLIHQRITQYNSIELISRLLALVGAVAVFHMLPRTSWVAAIVWVTVAYSLTIGLWNLIAAWKVSAFPIAFSTKALFDMLSYGWKSYYSSLMVFLIGQMDVPFINHYLSEAQAGIFARVVYIGALVYFIPSTLSTILFPRLMQGGASECAAEDDRSRFTMLVSRLVALALLLLWALFALIGKWFLGIFGPEFPMGYGPLVILLGGVFLLGIETILANELARRGLPLYVVIYSTICFIVKVIANVALIPRFGMYGAAWSALATYAAFLVLVLAYCVKCYGYNVARTLIPQQGDFELVWEKVKGLIIKE